MKLIAKWQMMGTMRGIRMNLNNIDNSMLIGNPEAPDYPEDLTDYRKRMRGHCEEFDIESADCLLDNRDCIYDHDSCPKLKW
jgi:hypothetical protein